MASLDGVLLNFQCLEGFLWGWRYVEIEFGQEDEQSTAESSSGVAGP